MLVSDVGVCCSGVEATRGHFDCAAQPLQDTEMDRAPETCLRFTNRTGVLSGVSVVRFGAARLQACASLLWVFCAHRGVAKTNRRSLIAVFGSDHNGGHKHQWTAQVTDHFPVF